MPLVDTRVTEGIVGVMVLILIFVMNKKKIQVREVLTTIICIALLSALLATVFVPLTGW